MDCTEHGDALGRGQQTGRPSLGFEGRAMEISVAAIALPAAYWEDEIDTGLVRHAREADALGPTCRPAFRHRGGRATRGTVDPEHPDLERVRVVHAEPLTHRSSTNRHLIISRTSGNPKSVVDHIQYSRVLPRQMDAPDELLGRACGRLSASYD